MQIEIKKDNPTEPSVLDEKPETRVLRAVERARKLLPDQGPIGVFVHHNTLHHFEHLRFEDAVEEVTQILGSEPYMSHLKYVEAFVSGRITKESLSTAIDENMKSQILPEISAGFISMEPEKFYRKLLFIPSIHESHGAIEHLLQERGYLKTFVAQVSDYSKGCIRKQAEAVLKQRNVVDYSDSQIDAFALSSLWDWICKNLDDLKLCYPPRTPSFRFVSDDLVSSRLVTFLSAYSDQGIAYWGMPDREKGILSCFLTFVQRGERTLPSSLRWVEPKYLDGFRAQNSLIEGIHSLVQAIGIEQKDLECFIEQELLKLPGWTGTVSLLEKNVDLLPLKKMPFSLLELLAVRLLLLVSAKEEQSLHHQLLTETQLHYDLAHSFRFELFQLFQSLGVGIADLEKISKPQLESLVSILGQIDHFTRPRVLHQAYEGSYKNQMMNSLLVNKKRLELREDKPKLFQAFFCIDDREESLRRHLEEVEPQCETFGVAGFYGLDIRFQGINDPYSLPLCPASVTPKHFIQEIPQASSVELHQIASSRRGGVRRIARNLYDFSRDFVGSSVFTMLAGILSSVPIFFRIHFPRLSGLFLKALSDHFFPTVASDLVLERTDDKSQKDGLFVGFTPLEMADRVYNVLVGAGLSQFSPLVFIIGHGSSSLNNPHESAYNCGACAGKRGGPNGRSFAKMANMPSVRSILHSRGLLIPDETLFVGGYHDTCSDEIQFYDLDRVEGQKREALVEAKKAFDRARMFNAHERCRRFEDASKLSPSYALRHVEGRSQNLREPRPEYNHCTNSMCIVGRRDLTRDLFLDRRAFLVSYDAKNDPHAEKLAGILSSAIPVCAGINLEYYFSYVDTEKYGCGSKLPHNVVGLVGVMSGSQSDLRTGLSSQMIEIHEPVRLVTLVEASEQQMDEVFKKVPYLETLVKNQWVHLGILPQGESVPIWYEGGRRLKYSAASYSMPEFSTSRSYYEGKMGHLAPVLITKRGGK